MKKTDLLFFDLIDDYQIIYLFAHEHPDFDAHNSQKALALYLQEHYPTKTVVVVKDDDTSVEPESLGIILDCSNASRVAGKNFHHCRTTFLIDHHVSSGDFTDYRLIDEKAVATAELLACLLMKKTAKLSSEVAQCLLNAIVGDSLNFSIPSTTAQSLEIAALLVDCGASIDLAQRKVFACSFAEFRCLSALRELVELKDGLLSLKVTKEFVEHYQVSIDFAKEGIKEFKNIAEAAIIALFYETEDGLFNCSLRSAEIEINALARKFGGGGHRLACGIKNLDEAAQQKLLIDLADLIQKQSSTAKNL